MLTIHLILYKKKKKIKIKKDLVNAIFWDTETIEIKKKYQL